MAKSKRIVYVRLKDGVLDPQGETIRRALSQMGYSEISSVRSGRFFELEIDEDCQDVEKKVEEICSRLLANPVIEKYTVEAAS